MRRRNLRSIVLCAVFCFFSLVSVVTPVAVSAEEITSYDTEIQIREDGRIRVRELIEYDFGSNVRHGIIREIPTDHTNDVGTTYRMHIDEIEVRNLTTSASMPVSRNRVGKNIELKVGDPDATVTGKIMYELTYRVAGALSYFDGADELNWNVIGHTWEVPIRASKTVVILPPGAAETRETPFACYVGPLASRATNRCNTSISGDRITYLTQDLAPNEGVTVVARFPMGFVQVLPPDKVVNFFDTLWGKLTIGGIIILMILWYIVYPLWLPVRWYLMGRDPKRIGEGAVSAWFDPPKINGRELTAIETGAIVDEKIEPREFVALIIQLAQRGYIRIEESKKNTFTLSQDKKIDGAGELQDFETYFLTTLFSDKTHVRIKDESPLLGKLVIDIEDKVYHHMVADGFFPEHPKRIRTYYQIITAIATFTFNFLLLMSATIFGRIMPRKTVAGVQGAHVAKSLKNFLASQERQLNFQGDRLMLFEKLLPYAIAFGVEKAWNARFADVLKNYKPSWYAGATGERLVASALVPHIASGLTSSLRTGATTTRSSTGFSSGISGGSSGGGFGGGGGRSW